MKKLWNFSVLSGLALVSAQGFAADLSVGVSALHSNVELRSELSDDESKESIYENAPGFAVTADWDLGKSSLGLTLGRAQYYSGTESNVTSNSVIAHANMKPFSAAYGLVPFVGIQLGVDQLDFETTGLDLDTLNLVNIGASVGANYELARNMDLVLKLSHLRTAAPGTLKGEISGDTTGLVDTKVKFEELETIKNEVSLGVAYKI